MCVGLRTKETRPVKADRVHAREKSTKLSVERGAGKSGRVTKCFKCFKCLLQAKGTDYVISRVNSVQGMMQECVKRRMWTYRAKWVGEVERLQRQSETREAAGLGQGDRGMESTVCKCWGRGVGTGVDRMERSY